MATISKQQEEMLRRKKRNESAWQGVSDVTGAVGEGIQGLITGPNQGVNIPSTPSTSDIQRIYNSGDEAAIQQLQQQLSVEPTVNKGRVIGGATARTLQNFFLPTDTWSKMSHPDYDPTFGERALDTLSAMPVIGKLGSVPKSAKGYLQAFKALRGAKNASATSAKVAQTLKAAPVPTTSFSPLAQDFAGASAKTNLDLLSAIRVGDQTKDYAQVFKLLDDAEKAGVSLSPAVMGKVKKLVTPQEFANIQASMASRVKPTGMAQHQANLRNTETADTLAKHTSAVTSAETKATSDLAGVGTARTARSDALGDLGKSFNPVPLKGQGNLRQSVSLATSGLPYRAMGEFGVLEDDVMGGANETQSPSEIPTEDGGSVPAPDQIDDETLSNVSREELELYSNAMDSYIAELGNAAEQTGDRNLYSLFEKIHSDNMALKNRWMSLQEQRLAPKQQTFTDFLGGLGEMIYGMSPEGMGSIPSRRQADLMDEQLRQSQGSMTDMDRQIMGGANNAMSTLKDMMDVELQRAKVLAAQNPQGDPMFPYERDYKIAQTNQQQSVADLNGIMIQLMSTINDPKTSPEDRAIAQTNLSEVQQQLQQAFGE